MTITIQQNFLSERVLELSTTIGLNDLHVSIKTSKNTIVQKGLFIGGLKGRTQEYSALFGKNIDGCNGKHISKSNRICLNHLTSSLDSGNGAFLMVLLPICPESDLFGPVPGSVDETPRDRVDGFWAFLLLFPCVSLSTLSGHLQFFYLAFFNDLTKFVKIFGYFLYGAFNTAEA